MASHKKGAPRDLSGRKVLERMNEAERLTGALRSLHSSFFFVWCPGGRTEE